MFEEQIAQGRDMIQRLEAESMLSQTDRDALPSYRRVPTNEHNVWQETIEKKLQSAFGPDTFARYRTAWDLYNDELHRKQGDDYSRALNVYYRIVAFLEELDARARTSPAPSNRLAQHSERRSNMDTLNVDVPTQTYDVFISHAWEDKEAIARSLHAALVDQGIRVWFDEATLELGDSLRRKIDEGLARCRYGIVILSSHFLQKEWPQRELDGLVARETTSGEKAILPIWHELDRAAVTRYSPTLADRLAARSEEGIPAIVEQVLRVLKR